MRSRTLNNLQTNWKVEIFTVGKTGTFDLKQARDNF